MIFGLLGTPSPLTYVMSNVVRAIVQVTAGSHHMIGANCLTDFREAWPAQNDLDSPIVVASDMPRDDFAGYLLGAEIHFVLCLERVEDICDYMITCRQYDGLSAIRAATQSLSNLETLAIRPPSSVFSIVSTEGSFGSIVSRLIKFFRVTQAADTVDRVAAHLGFNNFADQPFSIFFSESKRALFPGLEGDLRLNESDHDALGEIAKSYNAVLKRCRIEHAYWHGYCFLEVNTPGIPVKGSLNLEGKARYLTYGPYFHLPNGGWAVEIIMDVDDCYSENRVGFDIHSSSLLAACTTTLPSAGSLACDMAFHVADSNQPIEIRVQLLNGAIEGNLRLRGARFSRI